MTAAELLTLIAAESPWYPRVYAQAAGIDKATLDPALAELWKHGLVLAPDWSRERGQGLALTPDGERAARDGHFLGRVLAGKHHDADSTLALPTTWDRGERARDSYLNPRPAPLTQLLIVLNLVVFFIGLSMAWRSGGGRMAWLEGTDTVTLMKLGAVTGDSLIRGEWWRLLTSAFLHIGVVHLALNLYCLAMVGGIAESLWGTWRFGVIYLASALAGGCLAMGHQPISMLAGASGAVWGSLTSLAVWLAFYRQHLPPDWVRDFARRVGTAILINGAISFWPRVSWEGHLGGAIGGIAMAVAMELIRPGYRRRIIAGTILAILVPIACVGGLLYTARHSHAWRPLLFHQALMRQSEWLRGRQVDLDAIAPPKLADLNLELSRTKVNVFRWQHVKEQARQVRQKAEELKANPGTAEPIIADLPERWIAYCDAVIGYTTDVIAFIDGERKDLSMQDVDTRWRELHATRWQP